MYRSEPFLFTLILAILPCYFIQITGEGITDPSEVAALRTIRSNLVDPMDNLNSWNSGDPCTSNWTGIICSAISSDTYLHIRELQLLKLNLSGSLAPEIGLVSHLALLDIMWNEINGSIPKEIGNLASLQILVLNGNQLSGSLPEEIGYLPNLKRLQIDQNQISGPIPESFANLSRTEHLHMNNNSLSGQVPPGLSKLPRLLHLLLDNNNLSGFLPQEFSTFSSLKILQLDNNNFSGSSIPGSYSNMSTLTKLSLRNCSLQGSIPDLSRIPKLGYLDLSWNQLTGKVPANNLAINITTIDLSNNILTGPIPTSFSGLPKIQKLSLENNHLSGYIPSFTWQSVTLDGNNSLILDLRNNSLTNISSPLNPPENVTILLFGNPICANANLANMIAYCRSNIINQVSGSYIHSKTSCPPCPTNYEFNPLSPIPCLCAIPLEIGFQLKSPGISDFRPYAEYFDIDLTSLLDVNLYQLHIDSYTWETGPRLNMQLQLFPDNTSLYNVSEILRIKSMIAGWKITLSDIFGPYELLYFALGYYENEFPNTSKSGLSKGALVGILLGAIAGSASVSAVIVVLVWRRYSRHQGVSKRRLLSKRPIKLDGVKCFTYQEMTLATDNFNNSTQIGQGGYGKVYKGILLDGTIVAIKRAQEGSLQGSKEFFTEIELLSRVHHRNLVSLVGYCDEEDEQMLVYEFIPNGTLRDHLSVKLKDPLNFPMRLRVALGTAKGILYLHTEADPPIFHRDIKASNILLDYRYVAKVADFGLSRLAPVPNVEGLLPNYVSTVVKGTPGYLDPEYFLTHKLTDKSDVYSLGVVFLELLTGKHPISHGKNIVREVNIACRSGKMFSVIDSRMGSYPSDCIGRFVSLALQCCRAEMEARPSMSEVVRELEKIWHMMPQADTMLGPIVTDSDMEVTPSLPSSSMVTAYPYISSDASLSELSNAGSAIAPR